VLIDLGVPRNVAPEIEDMDNVFLYNADDLDRVAAAALTGRDTAVSAAETLVAQEVSGFMRWTAMQDVIPTVRVLRDHFEKRVTEEAERAAEKLFSRAELDKSGKQAAILSAMSQAIVAKLLHPALARLKAGDERALELARAVHELFQLEAGGPQAEEADASEEENREARGC